jgi:LysR family transcriptional activator of mexEF-oprN operon
VSAPEFVTALIGAHLVSRFRKTAPRASFVVTFLSPSRAFEALNRGEVDVALGRFGALPKGMTAQPIFEDRYCVAARKGHPKLKGRITYAQYRSIGHVYAQSESEMAEEERSANTDDVAYTAFVPRWLTVLMIVATSDAIATCPRRLAERQAELMGLQVIKPPFVPDKISVSAVRRPGRADPGVDWLLAQIREAVSAPKAK